MSVYIRKRKIDTNECHYWSILPLGQNPYRPIYCEHSDAFQGRVLHTTQYTTPLQGIYIYSPYSALYYLYISIYVALYSLLFQEFGVHTLEHGAPQIAFICTKISVNGALYSVYHFLVLFCSPYLCTRVSVNGALHCKAFLLSTAGIALQSLSAALYIFHITH